MSGYEEIEGASAPIKAWISGVPVEHEAQNQLRNVASLPPFAGQQPREDPGVAGVTGGEALGLGGDAVEPFQAGALHPSRGAGLFAGEEVDRGAEWGPPSSAGDELGSVLPEVGRPTAVDAGCGDEAVELVADGLRVGGSSAG